MHGPFFPGVPSWLVLCGGLLVLALASLFLVGRARPPNAPADYDALRKRYEVISRISTTLFLVGIVFGFALSAQIEFRRPRYGIGAGIGARAALSYLTIALGGTSDRTWHEYFRYQAMYRPSFPLPATFDVWVLVAALCWGLVSVWALVIVS
jgi:hypothetical protein